MDHKSILRLVKKKAIRDSLLRDAIRVGHDSTDENSFTNLLVVASVFLSIASGWTTFSGIAEYIQWVPAVLITLAIQSLLFAAAWRIGNSITSRNFSFSTLLIYLTTMAVSVFFSYSSLLDYVYDAERRDFDKAEVMAKAANFNIFTHVESVQTSQKKLIETFQKSASTWAREIDALATPHAFDLEEALREAKGETALGEKKLEDEVTYGVKTRGYGTRAIKLRDTNAIQTKASTVAESRSSDFEEDTNDFILSISNISDNPGTTEPSAISVAHAECTKIISALQLQAPEKSQYCDPSVQLLATLGEIKEANRVLSDVESRCVFDAQTQNPSQVDAAVRNCLTALPISAAQKEEILLAIEDSSMWLGSDVHYFEVSLGALRRLELLAIGSLLIAIAIDALILLCAFLGASPPSYLAMRSPRDLDDLEDKTVAMMLLIQSAGLGDGGSPLRQSISKILNLAKFDFGLNYEQGYSAYLTEDDVSDLKIHHLIGVLLTRKLAREMTLKRKMSNHAGQSHENEIEEIRIIALKTRLIMWMADKVIRNDAATSSHEAVFGASTGSSDDPGLIGALLSTSTD